MEQSEEATMSDHLRSGPKELCRELRAVLRQLRPRRPGAVVAEASALLDGRAADRYAARGLPVPCWAWLNAFAHRPPEEISAIAISYPGQTWPGAAREIARELSRVGPAEAASVQSAVFVPAELEALSHGEPDPEPIVRAVRRQLATSRRAQDRTA